MAKIPCFLCSQELRKRIDKNQKPYFVCDPCGMQIFVRGHQGVVNLAQLVATLRQRDFPFREHARVLYEIQAVLTQIRGIKKEIKSLGGVLNFLSEDKHRERTRELLNARIEHLLSQLEQIANSDAH